MTDKGRGIPSGCPALIFLLLLAAPAAAQEAAYPAELAGRAREARLSEDPGWRALGRWKTGRFGDVESQADGPDFFLSPKGKKDPQAELEATLLAFFEPEPQGERAQHAQCRFPARYRWLKGRLGFDAARLPERSCPRFEEWRAQLDPGGAKLIFADAFLNNPASMYGHTFLRLTRKGALPGTDLLDYTVNFAGTPDESNALFYAIKGLLGVFPGQYSTMPYYMKAQEYNDLERRDLWEYELNLSEAQLDLLVRHGWEMGSTWFDYYFFSENCSYHLLTLIDAAAPELKLSDGFGFGVIPGDTLRAFLDRPGLIGAVKRRPSFWSEAAGRRARLSGPELSLATRVGRAPEPPLPASLEALAPERKALVLDSAHDYWQLRRGFGPQASTSTAEGGRWLLAERARLRIPSPSFTPPPAQPPHAGHRSARVGLGGGASGQGPFEQLDYRAALHDLPSAPEGFAPNSQLEMLDLKLRFDNKRREPYLETLDLVEIVSLSPLDPWVKKPSWRAQAGVDQAKELGCAAAACQYFQAGFGFGYAAAWRGQVLYALAEAEGGAGPVLPDGWRAGGGASAGLVLGLAPWWRVHAEARYTEFARSRHHERLRVISAFPIKRDWELRVTLDRETPAKEAGASLFYYF